MPPPYSCPKCLWTTQEPICASCNRFLTDDIDLAESYMTPPNLPSEPIDWATAFGHWGDVFMCVGYLKACMRQSGQEKVKILFVGPDMDIVDWLEAQPVVEEVVGIKAAGEQYRDFWGATTSPNSEVYDWWVLLNRLHRGLPKPERYTQTHVNHWWFDTKKGLPAQLWHDAELPDSARMFAYETLSRLFPVKPPKLIHLHPTSTMSELGHNHWQHWGAAIEWLLDKTPYTYVLTGKESIPFLPESPRLKNLIGVTKSNMEMLAISDCCDGSITTPNNVAHWSVIQKQKCLCVGNMATQFLSSYYRRFIQRGERLTYLNVDAPFSRFQAAACEWLDSE